MVEQATKKEGGMKPLQQLLLMSAISFLCLNFSSQESMIGDEDEPKINFYGLLIDKQQRTAEISHILIAGNYKDIDVYEKPPCKNDDPRLFMTTLSLATIHEIIPQTAAEGSCYSENFHVYNNRQYIEIVVVANNPAHTQAHYLLEKTKELSCRSSNQPTEWKKTISFAAIDRLIIHGYRTRKSPTHEPVYQKTTSECCECHPIPDGQECNVNPQVLDNFFNQIKQDLNDFCESQKRKILDFIEHNY